MTKLLIIFIALNIVNVIVQTVRSLFTIHGNKYTASLMNALAYMIYTVVIIYTVCDLPLWVKVIIVGLVNLVGVFLVKFVEEKTRKDKLWKIEATIKVEDFRDMKTDCIKNDFRYSYSFLYGKGSDYAQFNYYCYSRKDTIAVKNIIKKYDCKYFVSESKGILN